MVAHCSTTGASRSTLEVNDDTGCVGGGIPDQGFQRKQITSWEHELSITNVQTELEEMEWVTS